MRVADPRLEQRVFGLRFPNPVGLAAGFDKTARAVPAWPALGFGFAEIGTVTYHAQAGNPRPRMFRLPEDGALVNRLGFNNLGAAATAARLAAWERRLPGRVTPLGVNLGKSAVTPLESATADYVASLDLLWPYADYVVVNVSSPNTRGLRRLQERERLEEILAALLARGHRRPLLVKVSPDLEPEALDEVVDVARRAPPRRPGGGEHHRVPHRPCLAGRGPAARGRAQRPPAARAQHRAGAPRGGPRGGRPGRSSGSAGCPTPPAPGRSSAPGPRWCSSTRGWSTRGRRSRARSTAACCA